jgi:micrococcal nuclease
MKVLERAFESVVALVIVGSVLAVAVALPVENPVEQKPWEYKYRAKVVRVVDGDTVDLEVDLGFDVKLSGRFRLRGLDAPEIRTDAGKVSASRLKELLPVGQAVVVESAKDKREKYGRYLGVIFVGEKNVNLEMVQLGLASSKDY